MFRTARNYLGIGPYSAQENDEIWVIRGARVPFILRSRGNGTYQILGEAYVHGIMYGEALQPGQHSFEEVCLA